MGMGNSSQHSHGVGTFLRISSIVHTGLTIAWSLPWELRICRICRRGVDAEKVLKLPSNFFDQI